MTATDYYNQFGKAIMEEILEGDGGHSAIQSFLDHFQNETARILSTRIVNRDRGVVSILKQQNRKWNDICHLLEKKYHFTPLKRNAFWVIMKRDIPGLEQAELEQRMTKQLKGDLQ